MELTEKLIRIVLIRKPIHIFLIIIAFSFHASAVATDITFTVKERGTGDLIEGATVVIGNGEKYQTTSKEGKVSFSGVSAATEIKILAQGYESFSKVLKKVENKMTFYIYPVTLTGEGLLVTADRIIEKASKFTLSKQDLL
ncbi:MAG: hypothetical protein GXP19_00105, partial [Gammaproteobacteria bacterium]|nr:hypothetical protein [Gammaproteobacteria bacterium]